MCDNKKEESVYCLAKKIKTGANLHTETFIYIML